jgi:serine/threonine protein kinase
MVHLWYHETVNRLKSEDKTSVERAIATHFSDYSLQPASPDQQGQNGYGHNFVLEKEGKRYLLKVLFLEKMQGDIDVDQANTEIASYSAISSRYVAPLLDTKTTGKYAMLLFPLLEGQTLAQKMDGHTFSEDEIKDIGVAILLAISDIWRKGNIVHQDIKPANVFVTDTGDIKLLDFGAARYKQSPFRGTARHNFAYSSPEQILAAPPHSIEDGRHVIDDRSDVFGVGLTMYQLAEGKHPYEGKYPATSIAAGDVMPAVTRADISNELKEIIYKMLSFRSSQRPHASQALASLQQGKLVVPAFDKGKFYYAATNGLSRFHELSEEYPDLLDGVVADAKEVPKMPKEKTRLQVASKSLIIDPQTYLFQKPPLTTSKKVRALPYYSFSKDTTDGAAFVASFASDAQRRHDLIKSVLDFQVQAGATALVPPFFYIGDFNDAAWSVDQAITEDALKMIQSDALPLPIIKGIALQQDVLTSSSKESMIEYLTSLENVAGFLVLLDSGHSEVITDEPWLKSAKELFTQLLSTGKSVIWARADVSSLVMAHPALSVSMGESLTSRKFNIDAERPSGGTQVPFMYLPKLFARVKWPEAMNALTAYGGYSELTCDGNCCEDKDFATPSGRQNEIRNLALHMVCQFGTQFRAYSGAGGASKAIADIKKAIEHFTSLRSSTNPLIRAALRNGDIKPQSSTFLENWLNALHSR